MNDSPARSPSRQFVSRVKNPLLSTRTNSSSGEITLHIFPWLHPQSAARPHNSPLSLRVLHWRFGPPGVRSSTQPTVRVAKGKWLIVACYAPELLLKTPESRRCERITDNFRSSLTGPPTARKTDTSKFARHLRDSDHELLKLGMWHNSCFAIWAEIAA